MLTLHHFFFFKIKVDSKIVLGLTGVVLVLASVSSSIGLLSFLKLSGRVRIKKGLNLKLLKLCFDLVGKQLLFSILKLALTMLR